MGQAGMVPELSRLIRDRERILAGGQDYQTWVQAVAQSCLDGLELYGAGGLIVPQFGQQAGVPVTFSLQSTDEGITDYAGTIQAMVTSLWSSGSVESAVHDLECKVKDQQVVCIFVPIAYWFDRPIGYFWALTSEEGASRTISALEHAAYLIFTVVYGERARFAIDNLAKPAWIGTSTTTRTVTEVIEACRAALFASAIIVWTLNEEKGVLQTLASVGNMGNQLRVDLGLGEGAAGKCAQDCKVIMIDDLLDIEELHQKGIEKIGHLELVEKSGWRSAVFVPLDTGVSVIGVMSAYGPRARGFSAIDRNIILAFAQRLSAGYIHSQRMSELTEMERRMSNITPAIEAGILAMERVHDADNELTMAKNDLSEITIQLGHDQANRFYKAAQAAGRHIDQALKTIRELTRRSKMRQIVPSRFLLDELLSEAKKRVQQQAEQVGANIKINCPANLELKADKDKLLRVFLNLFGNSIYWLETDGKGGHRKIEISVESLPESVEISVKDNGPGISPYEIRKLFDYFYTTKLDGMGFGLPIAKAIVKGHGGSINVRSRWGYETEFIITLPYTVGKHYL